MDAHSPSVDCVELIFHTSSTRRALATSRPRIMASLGDGRPLNIKLSRLARDQVLCLIAAWLDHQPLVNGVLIRVLHIAANRACIEGLPGILLIASLDLAMSSDLHHAIYQRLVQLILLVPSVLCCAARNKVLLPLGVLLGNQTHG